MDTKIHIDSFERLLKERCDEFRMHPERNVWQSIYNNIYPGRRFPSVIIGLLLAAVFPLIGYLNNNNKPKQVAAHTVSSTNDIAYQNTTTFPAKKITSGLITVVDKDESLNVAVNNNPTSIIPTATDIAMANRNLALYQHRSFAAHNPSILTMNLLSKKIGTDKNIRSYKNEIAINTKEIISADAESGTAEKNNVTEKYKPRPGEQLSKKWTDKLALQVYASPSVVYGIVANQKNNFTETQDANNQNASIGLEAGTAMQYALSDLIKVKAGLQFNYASYDVEAYQNDHPSAPVINDIATANAAYSLARSIEYSNNLAPVTLHNETYQFSLPVGLELKLLKNHNLQWNAGATIQPTYIAGGNAYSLSADSHSMIDESSIINRWNLNAGFETFLTYKVNGMTWQFGPQFRYQFSSTYGKGYAVDEKLAVFGIKIGVSKVLH